MNPAILNSQFVTVALPILVGFFLATVSQNKRFDDMNRRFDEIMKRLDRMDERFDRLEKLLGDHDQRLTRLEERTSPLARPR